MVSGVTLRINHRQSAIHARFKPSEIVCNVSRISCLNSSMISRSVLPTNNEAVRSGSAMNRPSRYKLWVRRYCLVSLEINR